MTSARRSTSLVHRGGVVASRIDSPLLMLARQLMPPIAGLAKEKKPFSE
jgi:hypothetical protein